MVKHHYVTGVFLSAMLSVSHIYIFCETKKKTIAKPLEFELWSRALFIPSALFSGHLAMQMSLYETVSTFKL